MSDKHTTHFDDCGCISDKLRKENEKLQSHIQELEEELNQIRKTVKFFNNDGVCECPMHPDKQNQSHACPCSLHKSELEDIVVRHAQQGGEKK